MSYPRRVSSDGPDLVGSYTVSAESRARLEADGHVLLPGLLAKEEVEACRAPLAAAVARVYGPLSRRERTLFMADSLWTRDSFARRFVLARRFAGVAANLLGVPIVRLWRDVAFFKEPEDEITPWHQDSFWEPLDGHSLLLLWIALTDVTERMGPLTFATGSHRDGPITILDHNDGSQGRMLERLREAGHPIVHHAPMRAGDASAHLGWTLHSSPRNTSGLRREAITIIYFPDGARVSIPRRPPCSPEEDAAWREVNAHHMAARLPGLSPGDVAVSRECPIVFAR